MLATRFRSRHGCCRFLSRFLPHVRFQGVGSRCAHEFRFLILTAFPAMASSRGFGCRRVLFAAVAALPSLFLVATLHPLAVSAQDSQLIDCYRFDGVVTPNNTKCPNSNACCGPKANCLSNRLCANPGDPPNRWVRGPCAVKGGWDDGCAQICKYSTPSKVFPTKERHGLTQRSTRRVRRHLPARGPL